MKIISKEESLKVQLITLKNRYRKDLQELGVMDSAKSLIYDINNLLAKLKAEVARFGYEDINTLATKSDYVDLMKNRIIALEEDRDEILKVIES